METAYEPNRQWWDEVTPLHVKSAFYDVPGFIAGRSTLGSVELAALGDIRGKRVLHLQCHFGLDSLSLARLGAEVTAVDFSPVAISQAQELARVTKLDAHAEFICCNIFDLPEQLQRRYDIVFTSHGVLEWLFDIKAWGRLVERFLKPHGTFLIVEVHPFCLVFDEHTANDLRVRNSYGESGLGITAFNPSDYVDRSFTPRASRTKMLWPMSAIIEALLCNGLAIQEFREFPFTTYQHFPAMIKHEDGYWHMPKALPEIPLMFSVKAVREADDLDNK